jgi:antitoxin ParD1/3/4
MAMNMMLEIPEELNRHVMARVQTGEYTSAIEYVLDLVTRDRDRILAQEKLNCLLQDGLNSELEVVTTEYWKDLRASVLESDI